MKGSAPEDTSPEPVSSDATNCVKTANGATQKSRKNRRERKQIRSTLSSELDERVESNMALQVAAVANPGGASAVGKTTKRVSKQAATRLSSTLLQAEGEKVASIATEASNKRRFAKSVKASESQVSVASTKSSQSSAASALLAYPPPPRAAVAVPSDVSINNRTLRWENACEDSDEEADRIRQYKINRRKRYLAAANKKYSDWLKTLEYEHKRPPSRVPSGSSRARMSAGREIIVPSLIAKVTQLHSNSNHNHAPAILNYS